ncbi:MAG: hypothetical protein NZ741_08460 [Armatimonadetes bacterium]|nr:hypothetical protein [Armatimonadota bacterium]
MSTLHTVRTEASLSPEEYRQILEGLSIESIHLAECHVQVDHELMHTELPADAPIHVGMQEQVVRWEQKDGTLLFWHSYHLRGRRKRKQVLRIEAVYLVRYKTKQPVPAGFVHIFQRSTLLLTTYPYFRELVDSTMRRMGIPPITLPMVLVR